MKNSGLGFFTKFSSYHLIQKAHIRIKSFVIVLAIMDRIASIISKIKNNDFEISEEKRPVGDVPINSKAVPMAQNNAGFRRFTILTQNYGCAVLHTNA